jgi:hypothetical protein
MTKQRERSAQRDRAKKPQAGLKAKEIAERLQRLNPSLYNRIIGGKLKGIPGKKKPPKVAVPGGPFKPEDKKDPVPGGPFKRKKGPTFMKPMQVKKKNKPTRTSLKKRLADQAKRRK